LAIALVSVLGTQIFGIATIGFFKHASKYLNFHNPILFFVGLLELVSEVSRVISFSFRLFGNVFAGEVLLIVVSALVPYLAPLPFLLLEVFVGFVQALVFSLLTLVFLSIATVEHAEH
jgi:F-type H+-transporting ATPase subunit a